MSRENPHLTTNVIARLTGKETYTPMLTLRVLELWGMNTVPDDYVIEAEELSPMSSYSVEDGDYAMEYEWNGQQIKKLVRVIGGRLAGRAA